MKTTVLAFAAMAFLTGASPVEPTDPVREFGPETAPAILLPYIDDGAFSPGDWEWMRGKFPDATEQQKEEYAQIVEWREACSEGEKRRVREELAALGYPDVSLDGLPVTEPFCDQFAVEPYGGSYETFASFRHQLETTRPIFDAFLASMDLAEVIAHPQRKNFADNIRYRVTSEQMARSAFMWLAPSGSKPRTPKLTKAQKQIFSALLSAEIGRQDRSNTEWLKTVVTKDGWPTISNAGKDISSKAWLLTQHADHDPVWQIRVLRMMEPLVAAGEVSKQDYAYLYDRVMLKLTGKQRFATQVTCKDGERVPRPLEDEVELTELRASVDLEPFEEYLTWFSTPCAQN